MKKKAAAWLKPQGNGVARGLQRVVACVSWGLDPMEPAGHMLHEKPERRGTMMGEFGEKIWSFFLKQSSDAGVLMITQNELSAGGHKLSIAPCVNAQREPAWLSCCPHHSTVLR